jgi:hypothetical protein
MSEENEVRKVFWKESGHLVPRNLVPEMYDALPVFFYNQTFEPRASEKLNDQELLELKNFFI